MLRRTSRCGSTEQALAQAIDGLLAALDPDELAGLETLSLLDPDGPGLRWHYVEASDSWQVRLAGRPLGLVSRPWLAGEED